MKAPEKRSICMPRDQRYMNMGAMSRSQFANEHKVDSTSLLLSFMRLLKVSAYSFISFLILSMFFFVILSIKERMLIKYFSVVLILTMSRVPMDINVMAIRDGMKRLPASLDKLDIPRAMQTRNGTVITILWAITVDKASEFPIFPVFPARYTLNASPDVEPVGMRRFMNRAE